MSTEKSELHITDIEREDKGAWVAISRELNMTLGEWVIESLNKAAHDRAIDLERKKNGYYD